MEGRLTNSSWDVRAGGESADMRTGRRIGGLAYEMAVGKADSRAGGLACAKVSRRNVAWKSGQDSWRQADGGGGYFTGAD